MTSAYTLTDAERARIDKLDALVALGRGAVPALIAALDDPSWTVRRAAIASLAALGDDAAHELVDWLATRRTSEHAIAAAVDALVAARGNLTAEIARLLRAPEPAVIADGAVILGRRHAADASDALASLLAHPDDNVAVAAIEALGAIGGSVAYEALAELVRRREFFRSFPALQVISTSGDPRAVAAISELLVDPLFREEAIRALGRTGAVQAIAALASQLAEGPLALVAAALADAVTSAARGGNEEAVGAELAARLGAAAGTFLAALAGADRETRRALLEVLGWIGDAEAAVALARWLDDPFAAPAALAALRRIAGRDPSAIERLLAGDRVTDPAARAAALAMVQTRAASPAVRRLLADEDAELRAQACTALARIGDTTAVPALFDALADSSPRVAHAAAAAINSLGSADTPALATRAARSALPAVRRHALRILGYLGIAGTFEAARDAIDDRDPKVADVAIGVLGTLDDPRADALLAELARRPAEAIRIAAMRAASHRSGDAMIQLLEHGLTDDSAWVRYHACQGLGRRWRGGSAAAVIERLSDPMPQVRLAAIEALAFIRTPEAWDTLAAAASSAADPDQQRAALGGLALHDRERAIDLLLAGAASEDPATRLVALAALGPARSPHALAALVAAVRDPAREVREAAISLLADREDREAAEALVDLALDAPADDPVHAALSRPGAARIAAISARLSHTHVVGALTLASALARMHAPEATAALLEMLDTGDPSVRRTAATFLAATGAPGAAARIARLATIDPDPEVRRVCVTLAGR